MPKPREGETKNQFMSRCVPMVMEEGATQEQAVGKCMGIWNNSKKSVFDGVIFKHEQDKTEAE